MGETASMIGDGRRTRITRRFDWAEVHPGLVKAMLVAAYETDGRSDEIREICALSDGELIRQATTTFGRPPRGEWTDVLVPVLRERWLPRVPKGRLDEITRIVQFELSGPDRTVTLRTKADMLAFVGRRRNSETLKAILRQAFVHDHKRQVEVPSTGGGSAGRASGRIELRGRGAIDRRRPYPHQTEAWSKLDELMIRRKPAGLLVLPTGAGKTYTMAAWLVRRIEADPNLRVLWIADQQELVDQAARAFADQAAVMPPGESRTMRVIHGGANTVTVLGDAGLDVVCTTRQSLLGRNFDQAAKKRIAGFLSRPTIVVVDEAHHAVSPTYQDLLGFVGECSAKSALVGLTATPWPSGWGMTAMLRRTFPFEIASVEVRDLVHDGVLARPVFHTLQTGEGVTVHPDELRQAVGRDIPAAVLRRLDRSRRNEMIVDSWLKRREQWGKTLVFACDIEHADNLGRLFGEAGVPTRVIHTRAEVDRAGTLEDFRRAKEPAVLVSVGMLLEGVDVPDARTAYLTRPTTSRILMRQMIGRVLRGPAGGGEELAHIVDVRDRWSQDIDVLAPVEIPDIPATIAEDPEGETTRRLPPVLNELTNEPLGEDILRRIEKAYAELLQRPPHASALQSTELVGFYKLGHVNVPVFDHVRDRWEHLVDSILKDKPLGVSSPIRLFEDLPMPRPVPTDIREVVEFCRSQQSQPPLEPVRSTLSIRSIAEALVDQGSMTEAERIAWLQGRYDTTLARSAFFSFQAFHEAVQQEMWSVMGNNVPGSATHRSRS